MLLIVDLLGAYVANLFKSRRRLEAENLFLRHQLSIALRRRPSRVRLRASDRALLVWMTRLWPSLLGLARIVEPATILRWHRAGFRTYWRWKSRGRAGRPRIERELRDLIRRMSRENPLWGAPRIHGELLKLGFEVAESTVSPPEKKFFVPLCAYHVVEQNNVSRVPAGKHEPIHLEGREGTVEKVPMAAANQYRAKAWECLSLAECMNDPVERAEIVRFARMWMHLAEPIDEARGSYEFPREAEKNSKLNLVYHFPQNELRKIYGDVLSAPVPSRLTSLLHRLEGQ